MLWLRVAGTFSMRGSILKKAVKALMSGIFLPHTLLEIKRRIKAAAEMAQHYPQIPFPSGGTPKAKHESACVASN
jgi:hypothetical protein